MVGRHLAAAGQAGSGSLLQAGGRRQRRLPLLAVCRRGPCRRGCPVVARRRRGEGTSKAGPNCLADYGEAERYRFPGR